MYTSQKISSNDKMDRGKYCIKFWQNIC